MSDGAYANSTEGGKNPLDGFCPLRLPSDKDLSNHDETERRKCFVLGHLFLTMKGGSEGAWVPYVGEPKSPGGGLMKFL